MRLCQILGRLRPSRLLAPESPDQLLSPIQLLLTEDDIRLQLGLASLYSRRDVHGSTGVMYVWILKG